MGIWKKVFAPAPTVEDLSHLLDPAWTGGTVTVSHSGGAVTLIATGLARDAAGGSRTPVLTLPRRLWPTSRLLSAHYSSTGQVVRIWGSGSVEIDTPGTVEDHFDMTWVALGGA